MLFNSPVFLLGFLPLTVIGFFAWRRRCSNWAAATWLIGASIVFYAWWEPWYLPILACSIVANFATGFALHHAVRLATRRRILILGIAFNLTYLGLFKYSVFFIANVNAVLQTTLPTTQFTLPLAISFFTFTQIAYLVDSHRMGSSTYSLREYTLFVSFFPHLIAGPIVHHWQILPQFLKQRPAITVASFSAALTMFLVGLFEKVLIADTLAGPANAVFSAASHGEPVTFVEAWLGAIAYAMQIYFDFAGYSDMAIGLANMFGIKFPANFNSPYQSTSIIDFWGRWHITLSSFLREYLYIPLGGNRKGRARRYINLMITMMLGGLWHGAGWTFVFWGALHGLYLIINHAWRATSAARWPFWHTSRLGNWCMRCLTLVAVVVAWVFFRANNWNTAIALVGDMLPIHVAYLGAPPLVSGVQILFVVAIAAMTLVAPNGQQWLFGRQLLFGSSEAVQGPVWQPNLRTGLVIGGLLFFVFKSFFVLAPTQFIYFNF